MIIIRKAIVCGAIAAALTVGFAANEAVGSDQPAPRTPQSCVDALAAADEVIDQQARMSGTQAALSIALNMGLDNADRIRANLESERAELGRQLHVFREAAYTCRTGG